MENNEKSEVIEVTTASENNFVKFFKKIGNWLLKVWGNFSNKHPKLAKILYQIAMFWVFSMMVTVFQYVVMTFLPYAFGLELAATEFIWPKVTLNLFGYDVNFSILGYDVLKDKAGQVIIGGGLGYFISFELATFLAQVINFPLQRNITFKSKGNVWFQMMWYFIAWILISLLCNAITSIWIGLASQIGLPDAIYQILTTFITGGVSMIIFFFVFKIIFPEGEASKRKA